MGLNLFSACHKCKEKVFHFRGKEGETILPFYLKHRKCLESDPKTSVETLEDQVQERDWMRDDSEYKEADEQQ